MTLSQLTRLLALPCLAAACVSPVSDPAAPSPAPSAKPMTEVVAPTGEAAALRADLAALRARVAHAESEGRAMPCSRQIAAEAEAVIVGTREFAFARGRLDDLRDSLAPSAPQAFAAEPSPTDGTWGACRKLWFGKVADSAEAISALAEAGKLPPYPARFLDRVNSPAKLIAYLQSLLVSDFAKNGVDHRPELADGGMGIVKLALAGWPRNYIFHPELRRALLDFADRTWQNPATGFWGAWYQDGDKLRKEDDLALTFRMVTYRGGRVPNAAQIARTTLALRERAWPLGWRDDRGGMANRPNFAVARLLRIGWAGLTPDEKTAARGALSAMLRWCVTESLQGDGTFAASALDQGVNDAIYYGVSFLAEVGYFDKSRRFWTGEAFADAAAQKQRILAALRKARLQDAAWRRAVRLAGGKA